MSTTAGHSTESSCSLTVQLVIGSLVLPDQCVCAPVSCCSAPHAGEIQEFNNGVEIASQIIVEFCDFCWVHEGLTILSRVIQRRGHKPVFHEAFFSQYSIRVIDSPTYFATQGRMPLTCGSL